MNDISFRTEDITETVISETDDGNGNIVETTTTVTQTYLYITVSHRTAEEMADRFGFSEEQRQQLPALLEDENNMLWTSVLYGIGASDDAIVTVALSQIGNVGGQPYWSWYGFDSRVAWCACFVSWCANECGYAVFKTAIISRAVWILTVTFCGHSDVANTDAVRAWFYETAEKLIEVDADLFLLGGYGHSTEWPQEL